MNIIRDVLDKQLLDSNQKKIGKVDGLIMFLPEKGQPYLKAIEVGSIALARRLGPRAASMLKKLFKWFGTSEEPYRIPWSHSLVTGIDVSVPIDGKRTPAFATERWLNRKIIRRVPGG
jgi:hypothetical protein